jgi:PP-loop superfamily ATP-utilizing enzyme
VQELKYFGITEKNILAIATELENSEATNYSANLRTARRPKPPSLKEQALKRLTEAELTLIVDPDGTIRRALEALPDD